MSKRARISTSPADFGKLVGALIVGLAFASEKDTFKLAVRGFATIEQLVDNALRELLRGAAGKEVLDLPTNRKFALAEALGLMTPETRTLLKVLSSIRNDFAHGKIHDLDVPRARTLIKPVRDAFGRDALPEFDASATAHELLSGALVAGALAVYASINTARDERQRRDEALEAAVRSDTVTGAIRHHLGWTGDGGGDPVTPSAES